jgi:hypothetical protein
MKLTKITKEEYIALDEKKRFRISLKNSDFLIVLQEEDHYIVRMSLTSNFKSEQLFYVLRFAEEETELVVECYNGDYDDVTFIKWINILRKMTLLNTLKEV